MSKIKSCPNCNRSYSDLSLSFCLEDGSLLSASFELEDEEVVQNVQKGIRSRFYKHGRYSVKREQGTHHFHSLIAEFMQ